MCLAVFHPAGGERLSYMTRAEFHEADRSNPHGIGILWALNGKLKSSKFYNRVNDAWQCYKSVRELGVPMAVHFRFATHGVKSEQNCHPFYIHEELAIIHNGILPLEDPTDEKTDTQLFAERLYELKADPMSAEVWPLVLMATDGSKVVFMRATGEVFIAHQAAGHWRDGSWYSNYSYKAYAITTWKRKAYDSSSAANAGHHLGWEGVDARGNAKTDDEGFMEYLKTGERTAEEVAEDLRDLPLVGSDGSEVKRLRGDHREVVAVLSDDLVMCLECAPRTDPHEMLIYADEAATGFCDMCAEPLVWP